MKIHYTLDDSAARLPLAIRSTDGVWDRAASLRNAPGVHLVELTTQHMLNTGSTLVDELANYFDKGAPSESDPYALNACYDDRQNLEDLLRDLSDIQDRLSAFEDIETLFPASFDRELHFTLALTVVGYPAFGYVRTFKDSEGEEYHGMVVNLAQARPHLEEQAGEFSLNLLINTITYGFFNHEGFLVAYNEFIDHPRRRSDRLADQLKETLMSRGIAWYLSTSHDAEKPALLQGATDDGVATAVDEWNTMITTTRKRKASDEAMEDWLHGREAPPTREISIDHLGYRMAHTIADLRGVAGLREAIERGPDRFINLYNSLSGQKVTS